MLQLAVTLLQSLPRIFLWLVIPIAGISALLVPTRRSRPQAALGFVIAAVVSAIFLALDTAAFGYICCDQARMLFSILLDFRPGITVGFAVALLAGVAKPLAGILPMLGGAAATGWAAFLLRRGSRAAAIRFDSVATLAKGETAS